MKLEESSNNSHQNDKFYFNNPNKNKQNKSKNKRNIYNTSFNNNNHLYCPGGGATGGLYDGSDNKNNLQFLTNLDISNHFGQNNIEKSLCILITSIVITIFWFIYYYNVLLHYTLNTIFISGSILLDLICLFLILYLYIKLKQDILFNTVSKNMNIYIEIIISVNFLAKTILIVLIHSTFSILSLPYMLYISKLILDLYFLIVTVKLFMFSSCSYKFMEYMKYYYNFVLYYLFCVEEEESNNYYGGNEYMDFDELESNY